MLLQPEALSDGTQQVRDCNMTYRPPDRKTVLVLRCSSSEEEPQQAGVPDSIRERAASWQLVEWSDWWPSYFSTAGSEEALVLEAVVGRDYQDHQPNFTGFLLIGTGPLHPLAMKVISLALSARRPVLYCNDQGTLTPVRAVIPSVEELQVIPAL